MFKDDFRDSEKENLFEKENITGRNEEGAKANTPVKVLTATSIIGDKVENIKGEKLGEIKNIMMNVHTGCTEYIVLEYGGLMGMGSKLFAIPYKALSLNPDKKVFILNRDKEFLNSAPGFDKDHWPETNSRHWEEVNIYWRDRETGAPPIPYV